VYPKHLINVMKRVHHCKNIAELRGFKSKEKQRYKTQTSVQEREETTGSWRQQNKKKKAGSPKFALVNKYCQGDHIKENGMGSACSKDGSDVICILSSCTKT